MAANNLVVKQMQNFVFRLILTGRTAPPRLAYALTLLPLRLRSPAPSPPPRPRPPSHHVPHLATAVQAVKPVLHVLVQLGAVAEALVARGHPHQVGALVLHVAALQRALKLRLRRKETVYKPTVCWYGMR